MTGRLRSSRPLVAVVGPTASGKTELALRLCEALGGEIVGCDALQIRAGLPILTAKPTPAESGRAAHHLIGTLPIDEPATAARYAELADRVIDDILASGASLGAGLCRAFPLLATTFGTGCEETATAYVFAFSGALGAPDFLR